MKSKGLGDDVANFTRKTGLKKLTQIAMEAMGYKGCNCDERQTWLNNQFPYYKK